MLILGIESTCDETAVCLARTQNDDAHQLEILSDLVLSQQRAHAPFRGVVPEKAARLHTEHMSRLIQEALLQADVSADQLDGIAASVSPGLVGCLLVGNTAAKLLAWQHQIPYLGVDHIGE